MMHGVLVLAHLVMVQGLEVDVLVVEVKSLVEVEGVAVLAAVVDEVVLVWSGSDTTSGMCSLDGAINGIYCTCGAIRGMVVLTQNSASYCSPRILPSGIK